MKWCKQILEYRDNERKGEEAIELTCYVQMGDAERISLLRVRYGCVEPRGEADPGLHYRRAPDCMDN